MLQRILALELFVERLLIRITSLQQQVAALQQSLNQLTGTGGY